MILVLQALFALLIVWFVTNVIFLWCVIFAPATERALGPVAVVADAAGNTEGFDLDHKTKRAAPAGQSKELQIQRAHSLSPVIGGFGVKTAGGVRGSAAGIPVSSSHEGSNVYGSVATQPDASASCAAAANRSTLSQEACRA